MGIVIAINKHPLKDTHKIKSGKIINANDSNPLAIGKDEHKAEIQRLLQDTITPAKHTEKTEDIKKALKDL